MNIDLRWFFCRDFDENNTFGAWFFSKAFGFGDELFSLILFVYKLIKTIFIFLSFFALNKIDKGKSLVPNKLDIIFLIGIDLIHFGYRFIN